MKKMIKFDDTEIWISWIEKFYFDKRLDLNEKVVYNKFPFGKKHFIFFIGYKDNKEIRLLYIFFLEMSTCKRYSNNNKCMYFIIDIG